MTELTITIKVVEQTYKQKFLMYDEYKFLADDPVVKHCINEALSNARFEPEDIKVRALLQIK